VRREKRKRRDEEALGRWAVYQISKKACQERHDFGKDDARQS
jgi:hypothetical protein